jgi:hypothetical protein
MILELRSRLLLGNRAVRAVYILYRSLDSISGGRRRDEVDHIISVWLIDPMVFFEDEPTGRVIASHGVASGRYARIAGISGKGEDGRQGATA